MLDTFIDSYVARLRRFYRDFHRESVLEVAGQYHMGQMWVRELLILAHKASLLRLSNFVGTSDVVYEDWPHGEDFFDNAQNHAHVTIRVSAA
jgi:hypothetical protein